MCRPAEPTRPLVLRGPAAAACAGALLVSLLPLSGSAAISGTEPAGVAPSVPASTPALPRPASPAATGAPGAPGTYRIRCWQHGRLLFEETRITLESGHPAYELRLSGVDEAQRAMVVAETRNATCLIRQEAGPARRPTP